MSTSSARNNTLVIIALACAVLGAAAWFVTARDDGAEPASVRPLAVPAPVLPVAVTPPPSPTGERPAETLGVLDARLVATIVRSDPRSSFAAISRRDGSDSELLGIGERLAVDPRAVLVAIGDGWAEIDHAGTVVRITAASRLDPIAEGFLEAVRSAPRRELSEAERARRRALVDRLRARMDAPPGSGNRVRGSGAFADARTSAHWDGDRLTAVEIDDIEPGGLFDDLGFENGDRIESINGIALGDADAAARIIKEMVVADEIVADIDREGGPAEIAIPSDDLLDELRERFSQLPPEDLEALEDLPFQMPQDPNSQPQAD